MSNFESLKGKRVLITGANRGIGSEMINHFAAAGANIVACVRNPVDQSLHQHWSNLRDLHGVDIECLVFDLNDEVAVKKSMQKLHEKKLRIDILINNAGLMTSGLLQMTTLESFKETFQVNFFSIVQITQSISRLMMRQKSGSIINIASIAGVENFPGYSAYGASKAALIQFTKIAANELATYGIRVNAIAPALVETEMAQKMGAKAADGIFSRSATKRMTKPSEIADIALFLASEHSSFINGQTIRADGGM